MNRRVSLAILLVALVVAIPVSPVMAQGGSGRLPAPKAPKPKPTPVVKAVKEEAPAPPSARPPAKVPPIAFNQLVTASLDPRTSGQIKAGIYYDEYLMQASDDDIFTIFLQSPNAGLTVQVYDKDGRGLPTLRDPRSGEFKLDTQGGTLPGQGEFKLRVVGVLSEGSSGAIGYTIRLNRTGLTETGYQEKLQSIILAFNAPETKNVDETITKLESLVDEDANQPGAYELLGVMYLYHRNDTTKAGAAMENAIRLKGAAVFRVTHDPVIGRAPRRNRDGQYDWVEARTSWLRIQPDQLTLAEMTNEQATVFSLNGSQLRETLTSKAGTMTLISIKTPTQSKGYSFSPGTKSQAEADLILKLVRTYVPPRG